MKEYRKTIDLDPATKYAWVHLGPIPGFPAWHIQSLPGSYPFPTNAAAALFASNNKACWPDRTVEVVHLDGQRVEVEL